MTYNLLKFAHILGAILMGAILMGAGLVAVWMADLRSRQVRDLTAFAEAVRNIAVSYDGLVVPGSLLLLASGSWLIVALGALKPDTWTVFVAGSIVAVVVASALNAWIPRLYPAPSTLNEPEMKHPTMRVSCALVLVAFEAMSPATAADPVRERIDGFKASKKSVAAIEDAIGRGDTLTIEEQARLLAVFAEKIPDLHPADAKGGFFSAAKGEIWTNFSDFTAKAGTFQASAQQLRQTATSADADAALLNQRLRELKNSCSSCHQTYKRGR